MRVALAELGAATSLLYRLTSGALRTGLCALAGAGSEVELRLCQANRPLYLSDSHGTSATYSILSYIISTMLAIARLPPWIPLLWFGGFFEFGGSLQCRGDRPFSSADQNLTVSNYMLYLLISRDIIP